MTYPCVLIQVSGLYEGMDSFIVFKNLSTVAYRSL